MKKFTAVWYVLPIILIFSVTLRAQELPKPIFNTNETAEDLVDYSRAGNWTKINLSVKELNNLYKDYRKTVLDNKLSLQLLDFYALNIEEINKGVHDKNTYQIAFSANQITGIGVAFAEHFKYKISPYVSRLDYLGRELQLDNNGKNKIAFERRLNDIAYTWELLKPEILNKNGTKQSATFEKLALNIRLLKNNIGSAQTGVAISKYLDQIDVLEKLF